MPRKKKRKKPEANTDVSIGKIHDLSKKLMVKYKIPVMVNNTEEKNRWCDYISEKLKLDDDRFWVLNREFYWSLMNIEMSLGYILIAREACSDPFGVEKIGYKILDTMPNSFIPEAHFWYHINNAKECIYRCWERISAILQYAYFGENTGKNYFGKVVDEILEKEKDPKVPAINLLKKFRKHWEKDTARRNLTSHRESSPFLKDETEILVSNIYDNKGDNLFVIKNKYPNLVQEIETVKASYLRFLDVWKAVKQFIENIEPDH
jgi:hypothetical protein